MFLNNEFLLMNKDTPVLQFAYVQEGISKVFKESEWFRPDLKPFGYSELNGWLGSRQASKHRDSIAKLLKEMGCLNLEGFLRTTRGLTLNDTFWVKETDSALKWRDVSLYTNPFNEVISRIAFEGGLYGRHFRSTSPEFGVSGNYKKCWIRENDEIYLLKGGSTGAVNAGLEPFCEGLASQVSNIFCPNALHYDIAKFKGHDVSKCKLFTDEDRGYISVLNVLGEDVSDNAVFEYFKGIGREEDFRRMVVLDALILNQDRHRGNYGFLFDNNEVTIKTAAPVFDHNLSLLVYATESELEHIDEYLGSIGPKIGEDFNEMAHLMLTPKIKNDLKNLRGFSFDFSVCPNFSDLRKQTLNEQLNNQIDRILHDIRIIIPAHFEVEQPAESPAFSFENTPDYDYLKGMMSEGALDLLGRIVTAYEEGRIDLDLDSKLVIRDASYCPVSDGRPETIVLKWCAGKEGTDSMIASVESLAKSLRRASLADQISGAQSRTIHSTGHDGKSGPDVPGGR